jgi:hypothetical protein
MVQPVWNGLLHNLKVNLNAMSVLLCCDRGRWWLRYAWYAIDNQLFAIDSAYAGLHYRDCGAEQPL